MTVVVIFVYVILYWNTNESEPLTQESLLNISDFRYLISKPPVDVFVDRNGVRYPLFVMIIHSATYKKDVRMEIRETWARADCRALVYFALGAVSSPEAQEELEREDAEHNDIIQGNFLDVYKNVTYKHTMLLKWFLENTHGVNYLIKADDDIYPNFPNIAEYISRNATEKGFLMGPFRQSEKVNREGKYAVATEEWTDEWVPPYLIGHFVIYSKDTVKAIHEEEKSSKFFWQDDVFLLGFVRIQLDIKLTDVDPFQLRRDGCDRLINGTLAASGPKWMLAPFMKGNMTRHLWGKLKYSFSG